MKYASCLLIVTLIGLMTVGAVYSQNAPDEAVLKSIEAVQKEKQLEAAAHGETAPKAPLGGKEKGDADIGTSGTPLSPGGLVLPSRFQEEYPIRLAIMDFVSGAEMMLGSREFSILTQPFGKLLSAAKNKTFAFPLGALSLGIELQKLAPEIFAVVPGKNGGGFEDLTAVQEAVLKQGVSHIVFGVLSDIHYKEDANSGVHYGGVRISRTVYALDLNIVVYDLSRERSVLADTFTAEYSEDRPFNKDYINRNLFETLLKNVCTKAARTIVESAEEDSAFGIKPPTNSK